MNEIHAILGAGGAIGSPLAKELHAMGKKVRLAARQAVAVNTDDELFSGDLTDPHLIDLVTRGAAVVYVTIGFEYKTSVWESTWPAFMKNVIDSCLQNGCSLVFFDNMYLYCAAALAHMTEDSPVDPPSRKGKVRAAIHHMLIRAGEDRGLKFLIARSADFYGPGIGNSAFNTMVAQNLKKGKAAQWTGSADKIHQFTWTPDAGKAVAMLGTAEDTWNQVWHMPTADVRWTLRDWTTKVAAALKTKPRISVISDFMMVVLGLFIPVLREIREMTYQNSHDYVFDSSKFCRRFGLTPTDPETAIEELVSHLPD